MGNRCYFQFKGAECLEVGFRDRAVAALAEHQVKDFGLEHSQMFAWKEELRILEEIGRTYSDCTIALEYMIPRMGKRVDAVVLVGRYIFVLEFKVGEKRYPVEACDQVLDYVYDLKNFHSGSECRSLFPVLVCTEAPAESGCLTCEENGIYSIQKANGANLASLLEGIIESAQIQEDELDHALWLNSLYRPTPTIVEAAQALYQRNTVEDISRNEAGLTNIAATTECVNGIIRHSKANGRKSICFITGVPGAGKTLVGLNLAATRRPEAETLADEAAVFLSGNGPLIEVLQASLSEDQVRRNKLACEACKTNGAFVEKGKTACCGCVHSKRKNQIDAEVKSFVQGIHLFRDELFSSSEPPHEHIAIFDEAQRAWTEEQIDFKRKTSWTQKDPVHRSEPHCLIEYMDRHSDWACMICLVGGGQEINQGEAGVIEWFKALRDFFPTWDVYVSGAIQGESYLNEVSLESVAPHAVTVPQLHLAVDMRSFRNKNVAAFAEALVSNRPAEARELYEIISAEYPIYVTRDLNAAKEWVRSATKRPSDRYGIVADSYGQRIRADGILVPMDFNAVKWFLRGKDEIDSSYYMEIAASEFKIQGLEIDYAVVAWEGDYRYRDGEFRYHKFRGNSWQNVYADMPRRYLKNGYRVLLTRARQGYVIYVPRGSDIDQTRKPEYYDETYAYLLSAGIKELP